jgi:hypothetical protein
MNQPDTNQREMTVRAALDKSSQAAEWILAEIAAEHSDEAAKEIIIQLSEAEISSLLYEVDYTIPGLSQTLATAEQIAGAWGRIGQNWGAEFPGSNTIRQEEISRFLVGVLCTTDRETAGQRLAAMEEREPWTGDAILFAALHHNSTREGIHNTSRKTAEEGTILEVMSLVEETHPELWQDIQEGWEEVTDNPEKFWSHLSKEIKMAGAEKQNAQPTGEEEYLPL